MSEGKKLNSIEPVCSKDPQESSNASTKSSGLKSILRNSSTHPLFACLRAQTASVVFSPSSAASTSTVDDAETCAARVETLLINDHSETDFADDHETEHPVRPIPSIQIDTDSEKSPPIQKQSFFKRWSWSSLGKRNRSKDYLAPAPPPYVDQVPQPEQSLSHLPLIRRVGPAVAAPRDKNEPMRLINRRRNRLRRQQAQEEAQVEAQEEAQAKEQNHDETEQPQEVENQTEESASSWKQNQSNSNAQNKDMDPVIVSSLSLTNKDKVMDQNNQDICASKSEPEIGSCWLDRSDHLNLCSSNSTEQNGLIEVESDINDFADVKVMNRELSASGGGTLGSVFLTCEDQGMLFGIPQSQSIRGSYDKVLAELKTKLIHNLHRNKYVVNLSDCDEEDEEYTDLE